MASLFRYLAHTTHTHTHTDPVALLWTSDHLVAKAATYLPTRDEQPFSQLDPSNRAAADLSYTWIHPVCKYFRHYSWFFYILLTVHHVMILGKWPTWRTILFYVFIHIFNSLRVSSTSCSSSGETNCVNTTSGSSRWPCGVQVGSEQPPTQSDSDQRLYWHNVSLLMMSTMCSKHVES